jgi:hypothetical protein
MCVALALTLCLTALAVQGPPQSPPPNPPAAQNPPAPPNPPAAADKSYQGQLSKVDATTKEITVKGADNKEMVFTYNEKTQMAGIDNAPQGLSAKAGSKLKITYQENRGTNLATRVEVVPE